MFIIGQGRAIGAGAIVLSTLAGTTLAGTGPSSSQSPYLVPTRAGVSFNSVLTVGDSVPNTLTGQPYRMVGIPDGLGVLPNDDGTFDVVMNHELGATAGVARAHGQRGSFVSRWNINASTLQVNSGRDHNTAPGDVTVNGGSTAFARFCSGDLAAPSAYSWTDTSTGTTYGTDARIYMNGEETGAEGRAMAHILTGADRNRSIELPRLGKFSWENSVASPYAQRKTLVMGQDDSTPGQVYLYVGEKQATGSTIDRAGLTNGNLYGIRVQGSATESRTTPYAPGTRFDLFNHGDVSASTGAALNTLSNANSVTNFLRPEDGAWDPRPGYQNDYYFVTTDRFNNNNADASASNAGRSRLWRLRFDDITNPAAGGTVTPLLYGTEGQQMFDNICIDSLGRIVLQEDPGANDHLAKIWLYDTASGNYGIVASHDPARFGPGAPGLLTTDEESSGVIDMAGVLGQGWFMLDVQAHYSISGELVEGGQLLTMYIDPTVTPTPGAALLAGLGGVMVSRRRRR
jgi:hypothetical protein